MVPNLTLENENTALIRNVGNHYTNGTSSHLRRPKSSVSYFPNMLCISTGTEESLPLAVRWKTPSLSAQQYSQHKHNMYYNAFHVAHTVNFLIFVFYSTNALKNKIKYNHKIQFMLSVNSCISDTGVQL